LVAGFFASFLSLGQLNGLGSAVIVLSEAFLLPSENRPVNFRR